MVGGWKASYHLLRCRKCWRDGLGRGIRSLVLSVLSVKCLLDS